MTARLKELLDDAVGARCLFAMKELLSDLANDINQPLAAIAAFAQGSVQHLRSATADPADLLETSERIAAEALRAGEVVHRLGERLHGAAGRAELVDPSVLVGEALRRLEPAAEVPVRLHVEEPVPSIIGYAEGLTAAVSVLLLRCLETAAGPADHERVLRVNVVPSAPPDAVEIGIGIGGYDPFAPSGDILPQSVPPEAACLAGEIAVVRSPVEAHGGRLWVVAESRGLCSARLMLPADRL
jgi:signal transduction histidine kinase